IDGDSNDTAFQFSDEEAGAGGFTIVQILHMLRAYLWISAAAFVVLAALSFVVIKSLPKSFNATAALIVQTDNTDPLAGRNPALGQTGTFFPTQVELINNIVMLQPVVDRLDLRSDKHFTGGFAG